MNNNRKESSIYSRVPLDAVLIDRRINTAGCVLGIVNVLVAQYGITVTPVTKRIRQYTAPSARLISFMEKLHFAKVTYWK